MIIDISWPLTPDVTEYRDRKTVRIEPFKQFDTDNMRETMLIIHNHTGTHVDAPAHFLRDGSTIDALSFDALIGPCRVLDLTHIDECIIAQDLEIGNIEKGERILLKTKNSLYSATDNFDPDFIYLRKDAALYLAELQIACVGIDYLGIERRQPDHETHKYLMERNIVIIEGLRLGHVKPDSYQLCCLPLNIPGIDGAPARAVLIAK